MGTEEFYDEDGYGEEEATWELSPQDARVAQIVEGVLEGRENGAAQHDEQTQQQLAAYAEQLEVDYPDLRDPHLAQQVHTVAQSLARADGHDPETAAPAFWRAATVALGIGTTHGPRRGTALGVGTPDELGDAIVRANDGHARRGALPF